MLKELYLAIAAKLAAIVDETNKPIFKHIELYNNQWAYLSEIKPISYPCCMIEFTNIPFEQLSAKVQAANTIIKLHIGSYGLLDNRYGSTGHANTLTHLDLLDIVNNWMSGFNGTGFNSFTRVSLEPDQDHDEVIIHVLSYRTRIIDNGSIRAMIEVKGDKLIVSPQIV